MRARAAVPLLGAASLAVGISVVAAGSLRRLSQVSRLLAAAESRLDHQERLVARALALRLQGNEAAARELEAVLDALEADQDAALGAVADLLAKQGHLWVHGR